MGGSRVGGNESAGGSGVGGSGAGGSGVGASGLVVRGSLSVGVSMPTLRVRREHRRPWFDVRQQVKLIDMRSVVVHAC